ncbi:MAG: SDR family oxidoreductase [Bacteroidales bacterium]
MMLKDKLVWITGASSGIGEALALVCAGKGANLILSARNEEKLQGVKEKCEAEGVKAHVFPMDLSEPESIKAVASKVLSEHPVIDILINNGGISQRSLTVETVPEVDRRIMEINYFGTIALTKEVLPVMQKQNRGGIIVISSVVGKYGFPMRSAYSASKHALHGFFDTLRAELYNTGIDITIVCPGRIRTNISINALTLDGKIHGVMDPGQDKGIRADVCARKIIKGAMRKKREVYIGKGEVFLIYLRKYLPGLFFKIAAKISPT